MGVFATIMTEPAARAPDTEMVMIDATHLKTHRAGLEPDGQKGRAEG